MSVFIHIFFHYRLASKVLEQSIIFITVYMPFLILNYRSHDESDDKNMKNASNQ